MHGVIALNYSCLADISATSCDGMKATYGVKDRVGHLTAC